MGFKVITPLVAVAPSDKSGDLDDANEGPRYFYQGAVIQDGFNDERCKELADEGMLEKVKAVKADAGSDGSPDTIEAILAEVGEDKEKAAAALETEKAGKNRTTLVSKLEAIVSA